MSVLEIIELIVIAIIALALSIYYIIKAIKNKWLGKITETLNKAIKEAEEKYVLGAAKKDYVLGEIQKLCEELNIPYYLIHKLISKIIDNIVKDHNIFVK